MTLRLEIRVIPDGISWIVEVTPERGEVFTFCVLGATEEEALDNAEAVLRQAVAARVPIRNPNPRQP